MKKTSMVLSLIIASAMAVSVFAGCAVEGNSGKQTDRSVPEATNGNVQGDASHNTEGPDLYIEHGYAPEDQNPNTDVCDFEDISGYIIRDAAVISMERDAASGMITFRCVADINETGKVDPLIFTVEADRICDSNGLPLDINGIDINYIHIETNGIDDCYPCVLTDVERVIYVDGEKLSAEQLEKYNDLFDPKLDYEDSEVIGSAVIVSASLNENSDKVFFQCAAMLYDNAVSYSPFTFSVPTSGVEFKYGEIPFDKLEGMIAEIEFSGIFMESYPMQAAGVTRVRIGDAVAQPEILDQCKSLFDFDECVEALSDYPAAIVDDGDLYYLTEETVDESEINKSALKYTVSYTSVMPSAGGETNFSRETGLPYAKVTGGLAIFYMGEWRLCTPRARELTSYTENHSDPLGISMAVSDVSPTGLTLTITQGDGNRTGETQTGSYFVLEKLEGDSWVALEFADGIDKDVMAWTCESYGISEAGAITMTVGWDHLYGSLGNGSYRIGKNIMDFRGTGDWDEVMYYAYFRIN